MLFPNATTPMPIQPAQTTILVVDDREENRLMLCDLVVSFGYNVLSAANGEQALRVLMEHPGIDIVLLDYMMPGMSGRDVLLQIPRAVKRLPLPPVLMVSADVSIERTIECLELGAKDYITKPIKSELLKTRLKSCLAERRMELLHLEHERFIERQNKELELRVEAQVAEITRAQLATIFALSRLAESRDPETGQHLERIARYCSILCQRLAELRTHAPVLTPEFQRTLENASPLHDIGKVAVPDHILRKPGKLTPEEFELMKQHTIWGAQTLEHVNRLHPGSNYVQMGIEIARSHHERWDGRGYPDGIAGEAIPLSARILSLADVYDALSSKRCYKDAFTHDSCRGILVEGRGTQFDPIIVDAFLESEREFEATALKLAQ